MAGKTVAQVGDRFDGDLARFVHLPAELVGYGTDGMAPHQDCRLDWRGAMAGSVEIVAACLESLGSAPAVKPG